jgi:type IV fimbrial biogenesis protein FimT
MLKLRNQRGVTVIEMVIALVIISLLLMIGLPSFVGYTAGLRVRSVAEGMVGALQQARIEAAKRNQPVRFVLDNSNGGGWSVLAADNSVLQTRSSTEGGSVVVDVSPAGAATITFNNLGQRTVPSAAAGVATLAVTLPGTGDCQPSGNVRCMAITIQPGGQARMCDPQRSSGDPQACDI